MLSDTLFTSNKIFIRLSPSNLHYSCHQMKCYFLFERGGELLLVFRWLKLMYQAGHVFPKLKRWLFIGIWANWGRKNYWVYHQGFGDENSSRRTKFSEIKLHFFCGVELRGSKTNAVCRVYSSADMSVAVFIAQNYLYKI